MALGQLMCACACVVSCGLQPTRLLCPWDFPGRNNRRGLPFPPPGDLLNPGIHPQSPASPALAGGFFTTSATWEALKHLRKDSMGSSNRPWCSEGVCVSPHALYPKALLSFGTKEALLVLKNWRTRVQTTNSLTLARCHGTNVSNFLFYKLEKLRPTLQGPYEHQPHNILHCAFQIIKCLRDVNCQYI